MSRKSKPVVHRIEADRSEQALVVHYELDKSRYQKKIRVQLDRSTNIAHLTQVLIQKYSKYLSFSKIDAIENLLVDLQFGSSRDNSDDMGGDFSASTSSVVASMDQIETYVEYLYDDDVSKKLSGTAAIVQLTKVAQHVEELSENELLMGLLSRVLSEEYKKSFDLAYDILQIFYAFSNFKELHDLLSNYRIGAITMKIIDFESKRHQLRLEEIQNKGDKYKRRLKETMKKQDRMFYTGFGILLNLAQDLHIERKMMLSRYSSSLVLLAVYFLKKLCIFEENKNVLVESQSAIETLIASIPCNSDKLLKFTLRLMFNLSFDPAIRERMMKQSMLPKLVELLKRPPFRALTIRILYHLSFDDRCKSMFSYTDAIPIVMQLVIHFPQPMVARELAALAINLTLNARNAELIVQKKDTVRALFSRVQKTRDVLLFKVLRNLTSFTFQLQSQQQSQQYRYPDLWTGMIPSFMEMAQDCDNHDILVEILAIIGHFTLVDVSENSASNPSTRSRKEAKDNDNNVDNDEYERRRPSSSVVGTGAWLRVIQSTSFLPFLHKLLVPGFAQDDVILHVVLIIGAFTLDPMCVNFLSSSRLIPILHTLLQHSSQDAEIQLRLLVCFYRFLRRSSRETLDRMTMTFIPDVLTLLSATRSSSASSRHEERIVIESSSSNHQHQIQAIQRVGEDILEIILDPSPTLSDTNHDDQEDMRRKIQRQRFEQYNAEFIRLLPDIDDDIDDDHDDDQYQYQEEARDDDYKR